ncbi:MAG: ribonuclease D [Alphaproteobacteria bacterium]|nr:ribonuclease D [Alphaproteobacteria bacterium]
MSITFHHGDLPNDITFDGSVAIDTETLGLNIKRDRLCLVQLSDHQGNCHIVQIPQFDPSQHHRAPNLCRLLNDPHILKIFHFARFDIAMLNFYLHCDCKPVYCTKIASKLARTYTDRHGLKDLCRDVLGVEISKQQQSSDWGHENLSPEQLNYAAHDVIYLHKLKEQLDDLLKRENRYHLVKACFDFLPTRAALDIAGWAELDIFAH